MTASDALNIEAEGLSPDDMAASAEVFKKLSMQDPADEGADDWESISVADVARAALALKACSQMPAEALATLIDRVSERQQ